MLYLIVQFVHISLLFLWTFGVEHIICASGLKLFCLNMRRLKMQTHVGVYLFVFMGRECLLRLLMKGHRHVYSLFHHPTTQACVPDGHIPKHKRRPAPPRLRHANDMVHTFSQHYSEPHTPTVWRRQFEGPHRARLSLPVCSVWPSLFICLIKQSDPPVCHDILMADF